jgi:hypothetical protein
MALGPTPTTALGPPPFSVPAAAAGYDDRRPILGSIRPAPDGRAADGLAERQRTPGPVASPPPRPMTGGPADNRQPAAGVGPPLPRRHSQTHLAPQLQLGPPPPADDLGGEHDPGLMASFMRGVSLSDAGTEADPARTNRTDGHG